MSTYRTSSTMWHHSLIPIFILFLLDSPGFFFSFFKNGFLCCVWLATEAQKGTGFSGAGHIGLCAAQHGCLETTLSSGRPARAPNRLTTSLVPIVLLL